MQLHPSTVVYSLLAITVAAYWIYFLVGRYFLH